MQPCRSQSTSLLSQSCIPELLPAFPWMQFLLRAEPFPGRGWVWMDVFVPRAVRVSPRCLSQSPPRPHLIQNYGNNLIFLPSFLPNERLCLQFDVGNGLKSLVFAGFLPDFAIPPFFGVCINTFVGLYTRLFGGGVVLLYRS